MGYPEHEKLHAVRDKSQACGEFLEWLRSRYALAVWHQHTPGCYEIVTRQERADELAFGRVPWGQDPTEKIPVRRCGLTEDMLCHRSPRTSALLAEFYGINEDALEAEKRSMLAALREAQP